MDVEEEAQAERGVEDRDWDGCKKASNGAEFAEEGVHGEPS